MKLPTREQLEKRRAIVLQDMAAKMEAEDFHGVADCAMDAREIDAMLKSVDRIAELEREVNDALRGKHALYHPPVCDHAAARYQPIVDAFVCPCGAERRGYADAKWELPSHA